jgi:hypothetical protein
VDDCNGCGGSYTTIYFVGLLWKDRFETWIATQQSHAPSWVTQCGDLVTTLETCDLSCVCTRSTLQLYLEQILYLKRLECSLFTIGVLKCILGYTWTKNSSCEKRALLLMGKRGKKTLKKIKIKKILLILRRTHKSRCKIWKCVHRYEHLGCPTLIYRHFHNVLNIDYRTIDIHEVFFPCACYVSE